MEIAGFRVVREVREEADRRVLAVFDEVALEAHVAIDDGAALAAEAAALEGIEHRHLAAIVDVATVDGAPVVLRAHQSCTLATWLLRRGAPTTGETSTVLAPVLETLDALHGTGVTGVRLDMRSIGIDDDGAPVLAGVGARLATDAPTPAWRAADAGVAADLHAASALVADLLGAAGAACPAPVASALERGALSEAADALLEAHPGLPLRMEAHDAPAPSRSARRRVASTGASGWVARALDAALAASRTVRRPVWIAGGLGLVAAIAALGVPALAGEPDDGDAATQGTGDDDALVAPAPVASPPEEATAAVDAALALLEQRDACIEHDDEQCLAAIVDADGGVELDAWSPAQDAEAEVVATMGDAVLVRIEGETAPASVLIVRTEAGWLLRDGWVE